MEKIIPITCSGQKFIAIEKLVNFQGNLKKLENSELRKLKRSILKYGFSFPVFCWQDKILDGHQRIFATKELLKEGYSIGDIPIVEIQAKNHQEAAEKLLFINTHYAKITQDGFSEFIELNALSLNQLIDLSIQDLNTDQFFENNNISDEKNNIIEEKIVYYTKTHFLISILTQKISNIQELIEKIKQIEGVEIVWIIYNTN